MGLTIHYKGKLKSPEFIQPLTEEVTDICQQFGWKYFIVPEGDPIAGICVSPEKCEPIFLTFDAEGTMVCLATIALDLTPGEYIFTKTQFAGMDTHMAIIHLLRHLSEKYFDFFELRDEGEYWETNDVEVLRRQFSRYEMAMAIVGSALESFKAKEGESAEGLAGRLEGYLRGKLQS